MRTLYAYMDDKLLRLNQTVLVVHFRTRKQCVLDALIKPIVKKNFFFFAKSVLKSNFLMNFLMNRRHKNHFFFIHYMEKYFSRFNSTFCIHTTCTEKHNLLGTEKQILLPKISTECRYHNHYHFHTQDPRGGLSHLAMDVAHTDKRPSNALARRLALWGQSCAH